MGQDLRGSAKIVNGVSDHVHILMRLPADLSVADRLRVVKANSSRWVHEKWPGHKRFAWQTGSASFSMSASNEAAVHRYISEQERHHGKMTFQEEFLIFLRKNGVEFDERYIWK